MKQIQLSQVYQTVRYRSSTPLNTIFMFVPQQEAWIVERMGKFNRILDPGLNILLPIIDRVKYVQSLKEIAIDVPKQSAITVDNVTLGIDGVLYLRILDPYLGKRTNLFHRTHSIKNFSYQSIIRSGRPRICHNSASSNNNEI